LVRFSFFADISHKINWELERPYRKQQYVDRQKIEELIKYVDDQDEWQRQILLPKRVIRKNRKSEAKNVIRQNSKSEAKALRNLYAFLYWILTLFIGSIVYSEFFDYCWIKWLAWIIIVFLMLIVVILPYFY